MAKKKTIKRLEDMTLDEAWRVLDERATCGRCGECFASNIFWKNATCRETSRHAIKILKAHCEELKPKQEAPKQEAPKSDESPVTEPFYQQTVDFMKQSGYKKCYMCGSELE